MRKYTLLTNARFCKPDEAMQVVSLPHTWNAFDGQDGGNDFFRGVCRYEIDLPAPSPDKRQYIEFRAANHIATVWCNGVMLGTHKGGFSTFRFDLTQVMQPENNILMVEVSNEPCNVYPQMADFTFFGGLYRNVYFVETNESHFDLLKDGTEGVFVTPYVSGTTRVDLFPVGYQGCDVRIELLDVEDQVVAGTVVPAQEHTFAELQVLQPHLWQGMEDPYCYRARASLCKDGNVLDEVTVTYGYRSYHVDPEKGFFLNGKSVPLRGVCRHQDRQDMGWAISEKEHLEDIDMIQEVGANTIRLAHYQHDQFFYNLCDQRGFAVWAEIPYISVHISGPEAYENTISQMRELIAQNYNHPSIIVWGVGNELLIGGFSEEQYRNLHDLNALCKRMDPSRLTTIAQLARTPEDSAQNYITDLVGYNVYRGWYVGTVEENGPVMDAFHATNPDKPYGISEYGVDTVVSWHSAKPINHDYTEEYSCLYHHHMLKEFAKRPYLWATHMWNMFDFAVDNRNEGGVKGRNCKGLVTFDRKIKKDSFYIYQAYWTKEPMVHISGRRFADRAPDERDVTVFTNCDEVTLFVNGEKLTTMQVQDHCVVFANVPLTDGENQVKAVTRDAEDCITLNGVAQHNTAYDLPDIAAAMAAGNWFITTEDTVDYGENGYHSRMTVKEICTNEECAQIFRGWIMSNSNMPLSKKLETIPRINTWPSRPMGQKLLVELKIVGEYFTQEDIEKLDKKLRSVKRP